MTMKSKWLCDYWVIATDLLCWYVLHRSATTVIVLGGNSRSVRSDYVDLSTLENTHLLAMALQKPLLSFSTIQSYIRKLMNPIPLKSSIRSCLLHVRSLYNCIFLFLIDTRLIDIIPSHIVADTYPNCKGHKHIIIVM